MTGDLNAKIRLSHLYIAVLIATDTVELSAMYYHLWDERPLGESFLPRGVI